MPLGSSLNKLFLEAPPAQPVDYFSSVFWALPLKESQPLAYSSNFLSLWTVICLLLPDVRRNLRHKGSVFAPPYVRLTVSCNADDDACGFSLPKRISPAVASVAQSRTVLRIMAYATTCNKNSESLC